MDAVQIEVIATRLGEIMKESFGGKSEGRYKISYERLKQLSCKTILQSDFLDSLNQECFLRGICLINLGHEFAIIETDILSGYRNVPQSIIEKTISVTRSGKLGIA